MEGRITFFFITLPAETTNTMKNLRLCTLLSIMLLPLLSYAEDYPVAFDRDADRTRTDRILYGIVLNGNIFSVNTPTKMYHDLTGETFCAHAGDLVSPSLTFTGRWMHSYIYIDKDNPKSSFSEGVTQGDWVRVQKDAATGLKGLKDANGLKDLNLAWHTLDGRRLQDKPTRPGIYIYGNRKYTIR